MKKQSTYSLLMNANAEDKGSSMFETVVYALVILCIAVSGWHVAGTKMTLPAFNPAVEAQKSIIATAPAAEQPQPIVIASRG